MFRNVDNFTRTKLFDEIFHELFAPISLPVQKVEDHEKVSYYTNGRLGRLTGPAIVYHDKKKPSEWWNEGVKLTEEAVNLIRIKYEDETQHSIFIDSKKYTVSGKKLREIEKILSA